MTVKGKIAVWTVTILGLGLYFKRDLDNLYAVHVDHKDPIVLPADKFLAEHP